ncbi:MAG TPA: aminotransferase class V-fold PLP-dependent enzyme [Gemmatimonadaceae bacterium]|nr:aminotransferase class V-fold PLP-dependent enzyme [Gemmatimonadaceae bacterium]
MNKREFLRTAGGAGLGLIFGDKLWAKYAAMPAPVLAGTEDFWDEIRGKYRLTTDYINLENGYYSMQSQPVLEAFIEKVRQINYEHSRYYRTRLVPDKTAVRDKLAALAGCTPEELIITRNTTESLDTVISGYDWKAGDEAVMAEQDYGAMRDQFRLMARRYGMTPISVSLPVDPRSDDEIVQLYANAITPRTRLLMICHMVNITGHILPVRKIADMAHAKGVDIMVDGAHAFAHLNYRIPDLGVDYYGASLHKWLGCPLGTGILYVKRDKVAKLWPIYAEAGVADDDIRKLNHTGTHPAHTDLAIEHAIAFHQMIGAERKEARLRYLQNYWTKQVRELPNVVMFTPSDPARSCAIANVGIKGMKPRDLSKTLLDDHRIWTVGIDNPAAGVQGVRVTPHLFTKTSELDAFVQAMRKLTA